MAAIRWEGLEGWVRPGLGFRIVEHTGEWFVYVAGNKLDGVGHPSEDAAKRAAEAVVDELDATTPLPPPHGPRPRRPEEYPWRPPHPGTHKRPPR